MNKEKTYNGNLNIGEKIVSIETDIVYQGLEIDFVGTMNITSLLPDTYIAQAGINKIIVLKMESNDIILTDLFSYRGMAMITRCKLIDANLNSYNLYINKPSLMVWNALRKTVSTGLTAGTQQDWAYLTSNWEDMSFDGNNNKRAYIHRQTSYDKETKTYTTTKEIRKK